MMIRPDGTIIVSEMDTMVGKGALFIPGVSAEEQSMVVLDVKGNELGTGTPGSVTLLLPVAQTRAWMERILGIIEEAGL